MQDLGKLPGPWLVPGWESMGAKVTLLGPSG